MKLFFRAIKISLLLLLILIVLFLVFAAICVTLLFQDKYEDKYTLTTTEISNDITLEIAEAAFNGDSINISDEDLNIFLYNFLSLPKESGDKTLNHLAIYNSNESSTAYAQVTYKNYNLALVLDFTMAVDTDAQKIYVTVENMTIGSLPMPDFLIPAILETALSSYDFLSIDGNIISFTSSFSYESVDITVEEIGTTDGGIIIKTNDIKEEVTEIAEEIIEDKIDEIIDNAEDATSGISENLQEYIDSIKEEYADEISDIEDILSGIGDSLESYLEEYYSS